MDKAKPCPFCGYDHFVMNPGYRETRMVCEKCGAKGPLRPTKAHAIQSWNERPGDAELTRLGAVNAELLAACEKALAAYDRAYASGKDSWSGRDVDEMRAAVAKAKEGAAAS